MQSKKMFPLWEQTKEKYVKDLWKAQDLILRYHSRNNYRDFKDLKYQCIKCWMNIRSYRDLLEKKDKYTKQVEQMEKIMLRPDVEEFTAWIEIWMFLNDAYKRLGIDDVAKQEDEDDYKTAVLEGLFD